MAKGTSIATPHVSGVAALIWAKYPFLKNDQVKNIILQSAEPNLIYGTGKTLMGGDLNLFRAFTLAAGRIL